jgi:hypothetical protein
MTHRKAIKWWETKGGNCEVTPQALWPIAKSLVERDVPKVPAAVHGPVGITYHPKEDGQHDCGLFRKSVHIS